MEEVLVGKSLRTSMHAGFKRAFSTILDANVSVMIAAIVLITMGAGTVKGFAVNLALGIVVSMFTAVLNHKGVRLPYSPCPDIAVHRLPYHPPTLFQ